MFRCITELKGLVVDIDSFNELIIDSWIEINKHVKCVFITASIETKRILDRHFSNVMLFEKYALLFSPNIKFHIKVLEKIGLKNTEVAYLSCNYSFIKNAMSFFSGTIWIADNPTYQQASSAPDVILSSISELCEELKNGVSGYYGEMVLFPNKSFSEANIIPVKLEVDKKEVPVFILGRYYHSSHYISKLHPYSIAISHNKIPGKSYTGVFDSVFIEIFTSAINALKPMYDIDCICAVPVKPMKPDRYKDVLQSVANNCAISNVGEHFKCVRNYPDQKTLSAQERQMNVKDAFSYEGSLVGRRVVIIDDISSTGSTIAECIRELRGKGAEEIIVVLLAVNQLGPTSYWGSEVPAIKCSKCGSDMELNVNRNGQFFYSCLACYKEGRGSSTKSFFSGWKEMCMVENQKYDDLVKLKYQKPLLGEEDDDSLVTFRIINCPYCNSNNPIDLQDISRVSTSDRPMGSDLLLVFDEIVMCEVCGRHFVLKGQVSLYPNNTLEKEDIRIEKYKDE